MAHVIENDLLGGPERGQPVPRIEGFSVENYRALHRLEIRRLTPMTVLLGPNGCGKSTVFDVFAFLSECFSEGLRKAWDRRGKFEELRTRGCKGPIVIELQYREAPDARPKSPLMTYHLAIEEGPRGPYVAEEWLRWTRRRGRAGRPFTFLQFREGKGEVASGETPDDNDQRILEELDSREMLAVNTLGQLARHPRVSALRRFITSWYLSYITAGSTKVPAEVGSQERLNVMGSNLPNVIQYLQECDERRLNFIVDRLRDRVPRLERVDLEPLKDGRLLLQFKDAPFDMPVQARFVSDGTLKMLAYLTVLYDPNPPQFVGIEEPENHLHPRLLPGLAGECRRASDSTQVLITTHSPHFVNGVNPEELWVLYRDDQGHTQVRQAGGMQGVREFMLEGAALGDLWMEGRFEVGDPLTNGGGSRTHSVARNNG
jgi:predicted ATPase